MQTNKRRAPEKSGGGAIMNLSIHSPSVKYAVIQVSSEPGSPERLVLAYRHEQSLCDFIAEPSIIARGFDHPEEAAALVTGNFTQSIPTRGAEQEPCVNENGQWNFGGSGDQLRKPEVYPPEANFRCKITTMLFRDDLPQTGSRSQRMQERCCSIMRKWLASISNLHRSVSIVKMIETRTRKVKWQRISQPWTKVALP